MAYHNSKTGLTTAFKRVNIVHLSRSLKVRRIQPMRREQLRTVLAICALTEQELAVITPKSLNDSTGFIMSYEGDR